MQCSCRDWLTIFAGDTKDEKKAGKVLGCELDMLQRTMPDWIPGQVDMARSLLLRRNGVSTSEEVDPGKSKQAGDRDGQDGDPRKPVAGENSGHSDNESYSERANCGV